MLKQEKKVKYNFNWFCPLLMVFIIKDIILKEYLSIRDDGTPLKSLMVAEHRFKQDFKKKLILGESRC